MDLDKNSHGIRLTFEMMVTSDFDMDVKEIVSYIAKSVRIKKIHDGFSIKDLTMEYSVHKDIETIEV